MFPREAKFYQKLPGKAVVCDLCEHHCRIEKDETGFCRARLNQNGILKTLVYGMPVLHKPEPIESQHLYHFYPGTKTYSVGTPGCNFRCWWCSQWNTIQMPASKILASVDKIEPAGIVGAAKINGCHSIAYTFSEPTVFFEYAYDIARLAKKAGLKNILVTNGYMSSKMLEAFLPYLDAASLDLKTYRKKTYFSNKTIERSVLLDNLRSMKKAGLWVEVSTLLLPGVNDQPAELGDIAAQIASTAGVQTPWHINRLYPWDPARQAPEGIESLELARQLGKDAGLQHIYLERLPGAYNTFCQTCGKLLVERSGTQVMTFYAPDGVCPKCRNAPAGVFDSAPASKALAAWTEKPLAR
jgi:pyruvate formate lyase activating enzyme